MQKRRGKKLHDRAMGGSTGPTPSGRKPTEEEIRHRAYEIYLTHGGEPGHELEDWQQAERELRQPYDVD